MSIRKKIAFSYFDRYTSLIVTVGSSIILARILTPEDIGVYSVTMVLLAFVTTVRDLGAGQYLVQEKDLTIDRIRATWTVQLGLGVLLGLVVVSASLPVAMFYSEPRMQAIMLVVALNYIINPFGSLTYAWQVRQMNFEGIALVRFSCTLAGSLVAVYLAWLGMGPISLALGSLTTTLVNAGMSMLYRPKFFPWLPGIKEIRRVLAFGSTLTGSSIVLTIAGSSPELLLGKLQSMAAAGYLSRANGLISMFHRVVLDGMIDVATSLFAKRTRSGEDISQPFLKATSYVTAIGWSFALSTIFLAHPVIRLLYGSQWDQSIDITRLLAVALACGLPASLCSSALLGRGAVNSLLRVTLINSVVTVILVAIGASAGLFELGISAIFATIFRCVLWLRTTFIEVRFSWTDLYKTLGTSALVGLTAGIGPCLAFFLCKPEADNVFLPLAVGVPSSVFGFVLSILLFKHPLTQEFTILLDRYHRR